MKRFVAAMAVIGIGTAAATAVLAGPAPAAAKDQPIFAGAHWDDDDDDRRRYGAMSLPNADAIRRAGIVDIVEVERDDGRIEVEGYDAQGRRLELHMDRQGQRVLSQRRDRDRDDWDD
jgi:hypothetical protein